MTNEFDLRILNQHFLTDDLSEPCSHGKIYLRVWNTIISDAVDGDWGINESALSLMRTARYGFPNHEVPPPKYYPDGVKEETLINCCGVYMLFCPSSITWKVSHLNEFVVLNNFVKDEKLKFNDLEVRIPTKQYARVIYKFAKEARDFFTGRNISVSDWEQFEGQYKLFWDEYEENMKYIKQTFLDSKL